MTPVRELDDGVGRREAADLPAFASTIAPGADDRY
jgi:hypothetical protein